MLAQTKNHAIPRTQTRSLITKILEERKDVLVLLCKVSGLAPFPASKPLVPLMTEFCELLVDYIAAAHFGLYQRLSEGQERRRAVVDLAMEIYPDIDRTTQIALAFNDKYAEAMPSEDLTALHRDLSHLGEILANRIDLEDRLIAAMLGEPIGPARSAA
ncbi:MAG: Rsd/AlgQ family anti-sigma factor [Gammaproteobacteria bacterium]